VAEVVEVVGRTGCTAVMAVSDMRCCRMAEVVDGYNYVVEVAEVGLALG
jgi:ribosomal protein S28E/S33